MPCQHPKTSSLQLVGSWVLHPAFIFLLLLKSAITFIPIFVLELLRLECHIGNLTRERELRLLWWEAVCLLLQTCWRGMPPRCDTNIKNECLKIIPGWRFDWCIAQRAIVFFNKTVRKQRQIFSVMWRMERKMREKTALLIKKKIFGWIFISCASIGTYREYASVSTMLMW